MDERDKTDLKEEIFAPLHREIKPARHRHYYTRKRRDQRPHSQFLGAPTTAAFKSINLLPQARTLYHPQCHSREASFIFALPSLASTPGWYTMEARGMDTLMTLEPPCHHLFGLWDSSKLRGLLFQPCINSRDDDNESSTPVLHGLQKATCRLDKTSSGFNGNHGTFPLGADYVVAQESGVR